MLERSPRRGKLAHRDNFPTGVNKFKPWQAFPISSLPVVGNSDAVPASLFVVVEGQSGLVFRETFFVSAGTGEREGKPVLRLAVPRLSLPSRAVPGDSRFRRVEKLLQPPSVFQNFGVNTARLAWRKPHQSL